jgi:hypothetical protein
MEGRSLLPLLLFVTTAAHGADLSLKEFVDLVRTGIEQHTPDKSLAKSLRKVTLSERLTLRYIEELQSEGAGPDSVAAMESLLDTSAAKPVATAIPPFSSPARPTIEEQRAFFRRLDSNAIHYSKSLPDFICNEVVHRYELTPPRRPAPNRSPATPPPLGTGVWQARDVLTVKLTYFENREKYDLILVNGKKARNTYESTGGAVSEGDFGSILLEIFSPDSGTKFQWDHWTRLRKRLTRVYAYRTLREKSHYRIGVGERPDERRIITAGRHGFVYADDETAMVMRITGEAEDIPRGFPVTAQSSMVDYDYATVGDRRYLLPLRVDNRMRTAYVHFKNVAEFKEYRKFTGESSISFDAPPDAGSPPDK